MRSILLAFCLMACATAPAVPTLPTPTAFAAAVRAGDLNPETYDFAAAGFWELDLTARAAWREEAQAILRPPGPALADTCDQEDRRALSALAWLQLAGTSPVADEWRTDAAALRAEVTRVDALLDARANGEADDGMYDTVRGFQQAMLAATDARAREALQRVIRDQSLRFISVDDPPEGLPERAADEWGLALGSRLVAVDCDNTSWLREQLAEIAWFDIPTYGERADRAAWLITQHADRTPEFQREVLARLESLPPGHTTQRNLAYLSDRIATAENRPQRYGTQMQCDENGSMQPMGGLEDESNVDARRASIGLPPLEEYRVLMARTNPCQERQ